MGGGLAANAATPGFGAFFLPSPQTVTATARALSPQRQISRCACSIRIVSRSQQTLVPGPVRLLCKPLQPAFYIVQITTDNPAPLNYSLALSADFFSGGVEVGGYIGPGITGFGAFYVPVDQDVSMHIFGKNAYGAAGAGRLVLTLPNASRNVIPQVGP